MSLPAISVVILSYQSAPFILESLQSITNQSYNNIELIICDDGSKDNSVEIISNWVLENKSLFKNIICCFSKTNTGIAAICNTGWQAASGEWIKFLAGDDILMKDYFRSNMEYVKKFPNASLVTSKLESFDNDTGKKIGVLPAHKIANNDLKLQLKGLLKGNYIKAPSVMIKRQLLVELNGFNTNYPMYEDDPFWIKANLAGYAFVENPEILTRYRIHNVSVSNSSLQFISPVFFPSYSNFKREVVLPLLKKHSMMKDYWTLKIRLSLSERIVKKGNNLKSFQNIPERIIFQMLKLF